jgi:sulfate transport system substrate-binding protein
MEPQKRAFASLPRIGKRWPTLSVLLALVVPACAPARDPNVDELKIGAYSVVREVMHDGVLPAFKEEWKKKTGRDVRFDESYNASGAQVRSIISGYDADLAILSHEGDMEALVKAGLIKQSWKDAPNGGMVTRSLVVIGVRSGNPKGIRDWEDLAKPGIGVLYPDPKTSGGARWNINAIYGAAYLASRKGDQGSADSDKARDLMARIQANVVNMDPSGRQSMANFAERGTGDAVITYENELLLRNREKDPLPYVIPPTTLLIESPAAVVESSVSSHGNRAVAEAFLDFLFSERGQRICADYGFRSAKADVPAPSQAQPLPPKVFTMADLGGWSEVEGKLYGQKGLWTTIFAADADAKASRR